MSIAGHMQAKRTIKIQQHRLVELGRFKVHELVVCYVDRAFFYFGSIPKVTQRVERVQHNEHPSYGSSMYRTHVHGPAHNDLLTFDGFVQPFRVSAVQRVDGGVPSGRFLLHLLNVVRGHDRRGINGTCAARERRNDNKSSGVRGVRGVRF